MPVVLVAESSGEVCRLLSSVLASVGVAVAPVMSQDETFEILQGDVVPDLIVMDVNLPGEMPVEFACRFIRDVPAGRSVPLLLLSPAAEGMPQRVVDAGATGFLVAPLTAADLLNWMAVHTNLPLPAHQAVAPTPAPDLADPDMVLPAMELPGLDLPAPDLGDLPELAPLPDTSPFPLPPVSPVPPPPPPPPPAAVPPPPAAVPPPSRPIPPPTSVPPPATLPTARPVVLDELVKAPAPPRGRRSSGLDTLSLLGGGATPPPVFIIGLSNQVKTLVRDIRARWSGLVDSAPTVPGLLSLMRKTRPAAILFDWDLQDTTGDAACRYIRMMPEYAEVPIFVALPPEIPEADGVLAACRATGGYMVPFTADELLADLTARGLLDLGCYKARPAPPPPPTAAPHPAPPPPVFSPVTPPPPPPVASPPPRPAPPPVAAPPPRPVPPPPAPPVVAPPPPRTAPAPVAPPPPVVPPPAPPPPAAPPSPPAEAKAVDFQSRGEACRAIGRMKMAEGIPFLVSLLEAGDAEVLEDACWSLGELAAPEAVRPLAAQLRHGHPPVRLAAALALGKIRDQSAVAPLMACLSDADDDLAVAVVSAIAAIGGPQARNALMLLSRHDSETIAAAAQLVLESVEP